MQKKTILQLSLILIVTIISIVVFKFYFSDKGQNNVTKKVKIDNKNFSNKTSNFVHDIEYISEDKEGNKYIIQSELGELKESEPGFILMRKVVAIVEMKNSTPINIFSDTAKYNNINYSTNFYGNVLITYDEHNITSDNLDLFFDKNLATISNNIIYKNLNTNLQADKVEIDLISKNSKIFMNDSSKKIKIVNVN
tara:strand:+ start:858 stop:1442 length:585 start_codon:yes stop_codon:yes gene_type:complete